jgi:hypothetical protein
VKDSADKSRLKRAEQSLKPEYVTQARSGAAEFPTREASQQARDDTAFERAVTAYRFW